MRMCARDGCALAAAQIIEGQAQLLTKDWRNGGTQAQDLEAQEARSSQALQSGAPDAPGVPALWRYETTASRLPHVRLLQRRAAGDRRGLMIRIALDAMGSDNAPQVEVEGTAQALREIPPDFQVQLVGRTADIEAALGRVSAVDRSRIEIVEAPEVVGMGDKPLAAVRGKPRSSIAVGLGLQKKRKSDAFISAGNTGAVMAASTLLLRLHPGVQRPAIGALFPSAGQPVLVVDAGANVDCDARELLGFAHLGSVYARDVLGRSNPTVGLLNIGEEDEKGNSVVKEAHQLLKQTPGLNYIGNVEGRDIPVGEARGQRLDVVACDGFVGNVVRKVYESAGRGFMWLLNREAPHVLQRPEMRNSVKVLDYATYGGAPLLGVQGVVIICHGASPAKAIKNAIRVAVQAVQSHLSDDIAAEFAEGKVPA